MQSACVKHVANFVTFGKYASCLVHTADTDKTDSLGLFVLVV